MAGKRLTEKGKRLQEMRSAYTRLHRLREAMAEARRQDVADELMVAARQVGYAIEVYDSCEGEGGE